MAIIIREAGFWRIESGLFELCRGAFHLYQNLGSQEPGRIPDFTCWQGKMWGRISGWKNGSRTSELRSESLSNLI